MFGPQIARLNAQAALVLLTCAVVPAHAQSQGAEANGTARSEGGAMERAPRQRLSDSVELDQIIELYMAGEYERCTDELDALLDPASKEPFSEPSVIERGRLYHASCSLLAGRREPARQSMRAALEANPLMPSPDSLTFPPPVVTLFLEVRDEVQQLISRREQEQLAELQRKAEEAEARAVARRAREEELRRLASEEKVYVRSSRVVAALPFGAGQFQNGKKGLGSFFLASEAIAVGGMIASGAILASVNSQLINSYSGTGNTVATSEWQKSHDASMAVLVASSWAFVGLAVAGVIEAQASFQKERVVETRPRHLPPHLSSDEAEREAEAEAEGESNGGLVSDSPAPTYSATPIHSVATDSLLSHGRRLEWIPTAGPLRDGFQVGIVGRF